jgi:hypothetical protein
MEALGERYDELIVEVPQPSADAEQPQAEQGA